MNVSFETLNRLRNSENRPLAAAAKNEYFRRRLGELCAVEISNMRTRV